MLGVVEAVKQAERGCRSELTPLLLMVSSLHQSHKISSVERTQLKNLILHSKDANVLACFHAFQLEQDEEELVDSLRVLCRTSTQEPNYVSHPIPFSSSKLAKLPPSRHSKASTTMPFPSASLLPSFPVSSITSTNSLPSSFSFATTPTTANPFVTSLPSFSSTAAPFASLAPQKEEEKQKETDALSYSNLLHSIKDEGWRKVLEPEFNKPYFKEIVKALEQEQASGIEIYPPVQDIMNAFNYTPLDKVKVVILGQDPYFNPDQAHGICFSVKRGCPVPPSLRQMYKELEDDIPGFQRPQHGCLEEWAHQGVLMLNATLTVRRGAANSHAKLGWQTFTDAVIRILNERKTGVVYLLWGAFAQKKGELVYTSKHIILKGAHPSPLAGTAFLGCKHFSTCNNLLQKQGLSPIDWRLSP
ncbi:Cation channel sperm-associated protein 2 [Balamuthia mandrillaris]